MVEHRAEIAHVEIAGRRQGSFPNGQSLLRK
jgi:hypothetical protein